MLGLKEILNNHDIEPIELLLGLLSVMFGIWILNPYTNTFNTVSSFRVISNIFNESVFGSIMFAVGLIQLYCIFRDHYKIEKNIAILSAVIWSFITVSFIYSNVAAVGIPIYLLFTISNLWVFYRLVLYKK